LGRIEEGTKLLEETSSEDSADGFLYRSTGNEPFLGLSEIVRGNIGEGLRHIEEAIAKRDEEGNPRFGDFAAGLLSEVYLQIIAGKEKLPFGVLLKNLPILLTVMFTGPSRIRALSMRILENPYLDRTG